MRRKKKRKDKHVLKELCGKKGKKILKDQEMIESTNTKYKQKRFIKTDRNIKVSFFFFTPTVFTPTTG